MNLSLFYTDYNSLHLKNVQWLYVQKINEWNFVASNRLFLWSDSAPQIRNCKTDSGRREVPLSPTCPDNSRLKCSLGEVSHPHEPT